VAEGTFDGQIMAMDDPTTLAAAQADPLGFLQDLRIRAIIDEVQRAPQLFLSIKKLIDENRKERRLILTGSTGNMSDIARLSGIKNTTLQRYVALLEHVFLILKIPAWTPNIEDQFVKSPKIFLNDTGLLCHLRGQGFGSLTDNRTTAGAFLENFIVNSALWRGPNDWRIWREFAGRSDFGGVG
jgi:predicted AAA+ superfamily ATPase